MSDRRVLVVDDDDAIRALLLTILRRRGIKVDSARDGMEAVDHFARCRYAVTLLDLMMPRMNGYELLDEIAKMPREQRPIVIVLTAGIEPRDLPSEIVSGTVRKPFDIEMLVDTIAACIHAAAAVDQRDECPPAESDHSLRPNNPN